jgi:uncharacterized membrane protein
MIWIIRIVAVICSGIYAGVILGDRVGATYARAVLSLPSFVQFQQIQHVHFKPILMPLTLVAVVTSAAWAGFGWSRWKQPEFQLATAAALLMILAFVITRTVNFPINDALMTWSPLAPPANVRELWAPWEHAHTVRAAASVVAFVLQVIALSLSAHIVSISR